MIKTGGDSGNGKRFFSRLSPQTSPGQKRTTALKKWSIGGGTPPQGSSRVGHPGGHNPRFRDMVEIWSHMGELWSQEVEIWSQKVVKREVPEVQETGHFESRKGPF